LKAGEQVLKASANMKKPLTDGQRVKLP